MIGITPAFHGDTVMAVWRWSGSASETGGTGRERAQRDGVALRAPRRLQRLGQLVHEVREDGAGVALGVEHEGRGDGPQCAQQARTLLRGAPEGGEREGGYDYTCTQSNS